MSFVGDERHLVFDCPAMQPVRDKYPALFLPAILTMQQFLWQLDIMGVAHYVMDCFDLLNAVDDDDDSKSSNQPSVAGTDV